MKALDECILMELLVLLLKIFHNFCIFQVYLTVKNCSERVNFNNNDNDNNNNKNKQPHDLLVYSLTHLPLDIQVVLLILVMPAIQKRIKINK